MTEPTTERGAWLEEVRADVVRAENSYGDARATEIDVLTKHAPAMLRALEAVEAVKRDYEPGTNGWTLGYEGYRDAVRKAIDDATSGAVPVRRAADPDCPCAACDPGRELAPGFRVPSRLSVCPDCDSKRCPKGANHRNECERSGA